ncbi:MAG: cell division protein FtsH, partial [Planctomycetota bacterium]|nr:cell division protein FtsH [Planctomycetota bacterium]
GRQHSETTAREIDMEIKGIIDHALKGAKHILETRRASLMAITRRLMEVESIDADELASIMNETTSGPTVVPGTSMAKTNTEESSGNLQRPASEDASNSGNG